MSLVRQGDGIKLIADRLGVEELRKLTARPGVNETLRLTATYHDGRQPDSVATLQRGMGAGCQLTVLYDRYDSAMQLYRYEFEIPLPRYHQLLAVLRQNKFDGMDDEPEMPIFGADLWLLERAAGSFYHDVIFAPAQARGNYRELALGLRKHLPEAVRELTTS